MPFNIREGMDVYGANGEKVGEVGQVVVGGTTREPRFFTIEKGFLFTKDYIVPREAITQVDDDGAHVSLTKDQVERLPQYRGEAPTDQEVRQAYEGLGARRGERGYVFEEAIFIAPAPEESVADRTPTRYEVWDEEYLLLPADERRSQGYRDEWDYRR